MNTQFICLQDRLINIDEIVLVYQTTSYSHGPSTVIRLRDGKELEFTRETVASIHDKINEVQKAKEL